MEIIKAVMLGGTSKKITAFVTPSKGNEWYTDSKLSPPNRYQKSKIKTQAEPTKAPARRWVKVEATF